MAVSRLYTRTGTQTSPGTKVDADVDNTNNYVNAHEANTTTAHGVSGAVCGTTTVQTLTNKTLTSPIITTSPTAAGATWTSLGTVTTVDINAGTWQGTIDGAWTAAGQTCASLGTVTTATINDGAFYGQPLIWSKTFILPEYIQGESDAVPVLPVEDEWAPFGILITKFGIKTDASSTYSVVLEDWTSANSGSAADISTVATAASLEAESGALAATVAAGDIVFIDLPTTTGVKWLVIWFIYEIKAS